jgi:hypothetical protein
MIVGPTKLNPRFLRSLLISSESSVFAGSSEIDFHSFWMGLPSTNPQM